MSRVIAFVNEIKEMKGQPDHTCIVRTFYANTGLAPTLSRGPTESGRLINPNSGLAEAVSIEHGHLFDFSDPVFGQIGCVYSWDDRAVLELQPIQVSLQSGLGLHNTRGPALVYQDGTQKYFVRGVEVPSYFYQPGFLTPGFIFDTLQFDADLQSYAIDVLGWGNLLDMLDAKVIDTDEPHIGTLYEARLPNREEPFRFLKVLCGTGRDNIVIPVLLEHKTAAQANAATFQDDEDGDVVLSTVVEVRT